MITQKYLRPPKTKMRLSLLLSFCSVLFFAACDNYGTKRQYGNIELYYTNEVTVSEANNLANYLIKLGFEDDNERKTVQLVKSGKTYQVRMVVKQGIEQDAEYQSVLKLFATKLSEDIFNGANVEVHACDSKLKTLRVFVMRY